MATIRQKKVAKILSENARKSVSSAMREAGYSDRSAEKPQRLTASRGWKEIMNKSLPDQLLLKTHKELFYNNDWRARLAALDRAYKLKGQYIDKRQITLNDMDDQKYDEAGAEAVLERYYKNKGRSNG